MNRQTFSFAAAVILLSTTAAREPNTAIASDRGDVTARLMSGDTSVCADTGTDAAVPLIINPDAYNKIVANGEKLPTAWGVSAIGVNRDIGEVRCEATYGSAGVIQFTIRPSLDHVGSALITVDKTSASERLSRWMADYAARKAR
jgi:hypothetical protein